MMKRSKIMKWLCALILPVMVHITVIISMNYHGSILETATGFAYGAIVFMLFWGLIVLIPTSIVQILCARALLRADCPNYQRFLVGLVNPSVAIATVIAVGVWVG